MSFATQLQININLPHCYGTQEIVRSRLRIYNHRAGATSKFCRNTIQWDKKSCDSPESTVRCNHGIELKSSLFNSIYVDVYLSAYQLRLCKIVGNSILMVYLYNIEQRIIVDLIDATKELSRNLASFVVSSDMIGQAHYLKSVIDERSAKRRWKVLKKKKNTRERIPLDNRDTWTFSYPSIRLRVRFCV